MGRRVASAALDSQVRARRILAGLSQQELARQAGLTRQAISAIEGGRYVPNTVVALRLARILSCRVEELFALPEAMVEHEVELAPPYAGPPAHHRATATRIVVAHLRDRWIAHPLTARRGLLESFTSADGVLDHPATPEAPGTARLLIDPQHIARTAVLLGCDPGLGIVSSHMARLARSSADGRLVWLEAGSQAALDAAASGTAHLAGSHLLDRASGECNLPQARQALAATGGVVVAFASWEQGLVVAPGNPRAIRTPADLARPDVRLVNREPGTGSRLLLDESLARAGVPPAQIRGYDRLVAGHFEVACTVAGGGADAGIALAAAAEAYGLDFIPLAEVRFDFVIPADHLPHPAVTLLLEALQTRALRQELRLLPGYNVDQMGTIRAEFPPAPKAPPSPLRAGAGLGR